MNIDCISTVLSHLNINKYEKIVKLIHEREQKRIIQYWKIHTKYEVIYTTSDELVIKEWIRNGKLHRDGDLPVVEYANGTKYWYKHNKMHRDGDLPAIVSAYGTKYWYKNGERHRDGDLPAVESANGTKCWCKNGNLHRDDDLPAVVSAYGTKKWFKNGVRYYPR